MTDAPRIWLSLPAVALMVAILSAITPSQAVEDPCALVFVPEDAEITCTVERSAPGLKDWKMSVHPADGAFAALSDLSLEPLDPPADPRQWLREQVQIDLSQVDGALSALLDDPDNPFSEESWWQSLQGLKSAVHSLSTLPLDACDPPRLRDNGDHEITCDWGFGQLRQYLTVRLAEREGQTYALHLQAMNERRLRHLTAIANSF